jgi:hypothetical protein
MPNGDDRTSATGQKIVAGLAAAGLCTLLLVGLVTGDISSSRYPYLKRSEDPVFFWAFMILIALGSAGAALFALGLVKPKPQSDYVAHVRRQTAERLTFLALLGAAGSGYLWISEGLAGRGSTISAIAGLDGAGAARPRPVAPAPPSQPGPHGPARRGSGRRPRGSGDDLSADAMMTEVPWCQTQRV